MLVSRIGFAIPYGCEQRSMISLTGYRIQNTLHESPKTIIFCGERQSDQAPVVLKLPRAMPLSLVEQVRLRNHYTIATLLDLPGVVRPLALEGDRDQLFLVMPDEGLLSLQDYYANPTERLRAEPLAVFLAIAIQLAQILDGLYRQRVIHKDIKPSNILIHPISGQIKLTDFGLSSQLPQETQELQSPTVLEGTLAYLSPEQTGRMNRGTDYRSDFYSLGVTFYKLLTGQLPFQSDDPLELVYAHLAKEPLPPEQLSLYPGHQFDATGTTTKVPKVISDITLKLMAKNAEDRYQSALGLKADLETCLERYQTTGAIADFSLGQVDDLTQFNIPQKLYGREAQVQPLLAVFDRVSQGSCELLLVSGYAGVGKTALVNEILKKLTHYKGYFARGKYDQFQRDIPLSAPIQAYRAAVYQLLTESEARLQYWRDRFQSSLGANAQLIIDVIPELELIIGTQPPVPQIGAMESANRLGLAFNKFTQVFQSVEHPIVCFIDDCQWFDSASQSSLQAYMADPNNHHALLILAYRDNEVSPVHPLMQTVEVIRKVGIPVTEINLKPLALADVSQLVAETLHTPLDRVMPLATLLFEKTAGNPFFLIQILKSLHEDGLIWFDPSFCDQEGQKIGMWKWDLLQIQQRGITANVVELMIGKITQLPEPTQRILQLAACIGNSFDLETLAIVSQQPIQPTAQKLWAALQVGLIVPIGKRYQLPQMFEADEMMDVLLQGEAITYRFLHDRVQQAAYFLIPEDQKQATHLEIGRLLLQNTPESELETRIFAIVNHWNTAVQLVTEPFEKVTLTQLNLMAGCKAKAAAAYADALKYLEISLELLPQESWQHQYEMTLTIHAETAETALLNTDFDRAQCLTEQMLTYARTNLDQVKAYNIQIQSYISQNQLLEALHIGQQVLQLLGVNLIDNKDPDALQQELHMVAQLYADRPIAHLIDLPRMVAPESIAAMRILAKLWAPAAMTNPSLTLLVILKQVELSIQSGHTSESAFAYALYASILISIKDEIEAGYEFGQLALNLLEHLGLQENHARTEVIVNNMIIPWKQALQSTLTPLLNAYQTGLETGDIEFASYAAVVYCYHRYFAGNNLASVERDMRAYADHLKQLNQLSGLLIQQLNHQVVLNLLHPSEAPTRLVGEACDETKLLQAESKNRMLLCYWHIHKLILAYLFEQPTEAIAEADAAMIYLDAIAGFTYIPPFYFYDSLAQLRVMPDATQLEQDTMLERVSANQNRMHLWATHAPMNHQHKYDLVEAERHRVLGDRAEAIELYDRAITGANTNGYIQEEALANELAARFYLEWGKPKVAASYMQEAYDGYYRWGAGAKLADLETRYPQLLAPGQYRQTHPEVMDVTSRAGDRPVAPSDNGKTSSSNTSTSLLDLPTVLKASQAISQEIQIERLLATLMQVVMQNTGAQTGTLCLKSGQGWQVAVCCLTAGRCQFDSKPLDQDGGVPLSLVNYVQRTLETVVVDDVTTLNPFMADPYWATRSTQSALCVPLLHQGNLIGILYLENHLATGAFASDRQELVQLIAAQAAISLENAQLYSTLEQKVTARTQELSQAIADLQATQQELVHSEKLAALGQLTASVAHEVNTPLGVIRAATSNIQTAFQSALHQLPALLQQLTSAQLTEFFTLVDTCLQQPSLATQTERQLRRHWQSYLADQGRADADRIATQLTLLRLQDIQPISSLLSAPDATTILEMAYNLVLQYQSTSSIQQEVDRAAKIVFALKSYSYQNRSGEKSLTDITELIEIGLTLYQSRIRQGIEIVRHYDPTIAPLPCNPDELTQVWVNLIDNALYAIRQRGTLEIQVFRQSGFVAVAMTDSGGGIPADQQAQIFEPFFTTKPRGQGSGLGLDIVRQIVEQHDGKIQVSSQPGRTTFTVFLPESSRATHE